MSKEVPAVSLSLLPGSIVAMTDQAADRLLRLDNGDAALLYIHLLRRGNLDSLTWPQPRLDAALSALKTVGMAPELAPRADIPAHDTEPPEYHMEDIAAVLADPSNGFSPLCDAVENLLGKKLNTPEVKTLYTLYDHLSLPMEVLLTLVTWCCDEMERKYGPGRKPHMPAIRKEGFAWARRGIDTLEKADAHIQRMTSLRSRENEVLRLLDISPRPLVEREKTYIAAWDDMGFDDEALRMAYERTVLKKQSMDWGYMNGILRRWHEKGLHTAAAIQTGDHDPRPRVGMSQNQTIPETPQNQQDYLDRMNRLLEQMKQEG
jgi:DnaD/phage-associated family protein